MTPSPIDTPTVGAHMAAFDRLAGDLPGKGALARLRADALARFAAAGIPTRRIEEWKFTGLDALSRAGFAPGPAAARPAIDRAAIDALPVCPEATVLVFVAGVFAPSLSDSPPKGVRLLSAVLAEGADDLAPMLATGQGRAGALVALNAAFMSDGAVVDIPAGAALERPLALVFLAGGDGAAVHSRNIVRLGEGARARLVELHASLPGAGSSFSNVVTDVALAANAHLAHLRVAAEAAGALHHGHAAVALGAEADYLGFALSVGGDLTRQESDVRFAAQGGRARLFGAYLGRGHSHMDHTTRVRHDHPGCTTEELFKGALDDRAHGVFQGLIHVAPGAVRTDARQRNMNLLLSAQAVADTKPELEILADDVKCSHGASVGDLDEDELFYMRARGIAPDAARRLLLTGYIDDVIDRVDDGELAAVLRAHARAWLGEEAR